jgi:hypothetical protein
MFREIRGVQQRQKAEFRRWFQDRYFDLFFTQDFSGEVRWFQLCYARDTWRERVLEWKRGRGFQHLRPKQPFAAGDRESGALVFDGVMPYIGVKEEFALSAPGLPEDVARFVAEKMREYARPDRKFHRPGVSTPSWIVRIRQRQKTEARQAAEPTQ